MTPPDYLTFVVPRNTLHRIAQREFPWQRGYFDVIQLYRYAYIYGQGKFAERFEINNNVTINEFSLTSFYLFSIFLKQSSIKRNFSLQQLNIDTRSINATLALLSMPVSQARRETMSMLIDERRMFGSPVPTAYQPSFLRKYPIIAFGKDNATLRAPLPEIILLRTTSGIYYDLIKDEMRSTLVNEASDRFEQYSRDYIAAMMPRFDVCRSHQYRFRKNRNDTPMAN